MDTIIKIKNLNFSYSKTGNKVLDNINLSIKRGEIFGVIGPTGAGKSTFMLHLNAILKGEGEILIDDILIGKTSPPRFLGELEDFSIAASTRRESSVGVKHGESGTVDMVLFTENEAGNKIVQIRLRDQRIPEIGDKFASRHGQKGVVGLIVPERP